MDTNPFQSPQAPGPDAVSASGADPRRFGRARQVPIVAALMMADGVLLCLIGIGWIIAAIFFMGRLFEQMELQQQMNPQGPGFPQGMRWYFQGAYGGIGGVALVAGLLNIFAGIRNYRFRSRTLGIVALFGGLASVLFCWCLPLSVGVLIYGLIIYLGQDAELAFRWQQAKDRTS